MLRGVVAAAHTLEVLARTGDRIKPVDSFNVPPPTYLMGVASVEEPLGHPVRILKLVYFGAFWGRHVKRERHNTKSVCREVVQPI